ncbi:hypothetical protein [Pedobacter sandarakinus]|uniref:hypothetical protein n=1 Tax=Pedobacter sandarakinus TaxID=353156 RepID=UPI0022472D0A|nr:hypothetical protein [Pedobacter sandarakinus]MCX2574017.1 hypothetical protein [Pedobacter sandarakinus]
MIGKSDVPVVIDIWGDIDVSNFNNTYSKCPYIYVTSKEVLEFLQPKTKIELKYFPMTLPDKYFKGEFDDSLAKSICEKKDIDIIQIGRGNAVLDEWTKQYLIANPNTNYVYQKVIDGRFFFYSNLYGEVCQRKDRSDYFNLLQRSKVALYSSAGIDDGVERTGGFNALTPRLLESLSQYTFIVGRYADNVEYREVRDHIKNCQSYDEFDSEMTRFLSIGDIEFLKWSQNFISKYLTSKWIKVLK